MKAKQSPRLKLAQDLRNLHGVFVEGSDDLRPWYAEAQRISERLANNIYGFDEEALESMTATLFYFLGDARNTVWSGSAGSSNSSPRWSARAGKGRLTTSLRAGLGPVGLAFSDSEVQ